MLIHEHTKSNLIKWYIKLQFLKDYIKYNIYFIRLMNKRFKMFLSLKLLKEGLYHRSLWKKKLEIKTNHAFDKLKCSRHFTVNTFS